MEHTSSLKQPLDPLDLPPAHSQAALFLSVQPQDPAFSTFHPQIMSRQCHLSQYCHVPSQTEAVSAAASHVPNHVQARQQFVSDAEQPHSATLQLPVASTQAACHLQAKAGHHGAQPSMHLRKRPCLGTEADIGSRLERHAEQLQAEYAAVRAGTGLLDDQAAWIAAARQTAHQVTFARGSVRAFRS